MRIVSLLPSATEIVYALDLDDQLVAVTFECDEPPGRAPTRPWWSAGGTPRGLTPGEIDAYVKAQLAGGGDLYTLHADALAGLAPELILTQDLCRVCALPSGHVTDALDHLGCRADVLTLDPYTLDEVLDTISAVGERTGVPDRAATVVAGLRERLATVAAAVAGRPRPRVAVVEWVDPPFTAGHWVPDLVRAAGGEPVAARPGSTVGADHLGRVRRRGARTWSSSRRAASTSPARPSRPRGSSRTFPDAQVWAIDADGIVVRPGPRLVDGVEAIAAILHPAVVARTARRGGGPGRVRSGRLRNDVDHPRHAEPVDALAELVAPHLLLQRDGDRAAVGQLGPVAPQVVGVVTAQAHHDVVAHGAARCRAARRRP